MKKQRKINPMKLQHITKLTRERMEAEMQRSRERAWSFDLGANSYSVHLPKTQRGYHE